MSLSNRRGAAGEKHTGKHRHVQPEIFLMQEAVFRRDLDIAQAGRESGARRLAVAERKNRGQLKILGSAIVEIHPCFAAASFARDCPVGEGIDFPMPVLRRLWVIQHKGWPRPSRTCPQKRNEDHQWTQGAMHSSSRSAKTVVSVWILISIQIFRPSCRLCNHAPPIRLTAQAATAGHRVSRRSASR